MSGITVHAVNAAGSNNADRRLFFVEHIADLNRRSVCTQNVAVFNVESILHRTRRVICRYIQGLEIVEIVFDFRAVRHFKTHTVKQLDHTLQSQSNWMQTAMFLRTARQSNIQCFCSQLSLQLGFIQGIPFAIKGRLKLIFAFVDVRAYGFTLFRRHLTQSFQKSGQFAGFTKIACFNLF